MASNSAPVSGRNGTHAVFLYPVAGGIINFTIDESVTPAICFGLVELIRIVCCFSVLYFLTLAQSSMCEVARFVAFPTFFSTSGALFSQVPIVRSAPYAFVRPFAIFLSTFIVVFFLATAFFHFESARFCIFLYVDFPAYCLVWVSVPFRFVDFFRTASDVRRKSMASSSFKLEPFSNRRRLFSSSWTLKSPALAGVWVHIPHNSKLRNQRFELGRVDRITNLQRFRPDVGIWIGIFGAKRDCFVQRCTFGATS